MNTATKKVLGQLNQDLFFVSLIAFVALFFLELTFPKFVIAYLDLNKLFLFCLITGGFAIAKQGSVEKTDKTEKKPALTGLIVLSAIAFVFILLFLKDMGGWGFLISLAGATVFFLLGLTLKDE